MVKAGPNGLIHFDEARRALAKVSTVDEAKAIRDKAEACRVYAKQAGAGLDLQNRCAEIKIWAERKAGELLAKMVKRHGARDGKTGSHRASPLADLGINYSQSSRWQREASVPDKAFGAYVAETIKARKELTSAGVLKLAVHQAREQANDAISDSTTDSVEDLDQLISQDKKFRCIYADPPWAYGNQATRAATDNHYPTMSVEDIAALPISSVAAENAHLHLWTTNAFLFDAKTIIESWGFEYKSCMVWVKPQMGIGNYWRVSHEFLLFGIRGKAPFRNRSQMSWVQADRTKHSKKPEVFRNIIEKVSPGPYLELFGRKQTHGWTVWGNEVSTERELFDELV